MRNSLLAATGLALSATAAFSQSAGSLPNGFIFDGEINASYLFSSSGDESLYTADIDLGYEFPLSGDIMLGVGVNMFALGDSGSFDSVFNPFIYADFGNFRLSFGGVDNAVAHRYDGFDIFSSAYMDLIGGIYINYGDFYIFNTSGQVVRGDASFGQINASISYDFELETTAVAGNYAINPNFTLYAGATFFPGGDVFIFSGEYTVGNFGLSASVQTLPGDTFMGLRGEYAFTDKLSVSVATLIDFDGGLTEIYEIAGHYDINDTFGLSASWLSLGGSSIGSIDLSVNF